MSYHKLVAQTKKIAEILDKGFSSAGIPCIITSFGKRNVKIFHENSDVRIYLYGRSTMRGKIELRKGGREVLRISSIHGLSGAEEIATRLQKEAIQAYE